MSAPTTSRFVQVERHGDIVTLSLSHPAELNKLATDEQFLELAEHIRRVNADRSARALIITGQGKAFCAGGDIHQMARKEGFSAGTPQDVRLKYKQAVQQVPLALYEADIPTIAAVNGAAYGAGCDLACMCDMRIASTNATFCVSFAQLGIVSGDGGSWMLPRLVGRSKAMELTFTAEPVGAEEALKCGLVSRVVEPDRLLCEALALAEKISRHPSEAVRMAKRLIRDAEHVSFASHLDMAAAFQAIAHASPEHQAAVDATVERLKNRRRVDG
jgi:enoyl-CoA hydratase/carnithine racemase